MQHDRRALEQLLDDLRIAADRDALEAVIEIIVVISEAERQPADDKRRQILAVTPPLLLRVALHELLVHIRTNERQRLLLKILRIDNIQFVDLFLNLRLHLLRRRQSPQLREGIHVEGEIVQLVFVLRHRRIDILVKLRKPVDILPHLPVRCVENVRAILVYIDPGPLFRKDVPAGVVPLVYHKAPLARRLGFVRKDRAEQARSDDQVIIFAARLRALLSVALEPLHARGLLLVHLVRVADRLRLTAHDHLAVVKPQDMVAQTPHRIQIVRNIQKRRSSRQKLLHTALAPLAELIVADRQNLIDNQDIRLNHRRHRESEPRLHAG